MLGRGTRNHRPDRAIKSRKRSCQE